jgi:transcriptional antiterminator RfaH
MIPGPTPERIPYHAQDEVEEPGMPYGAKWYVLVVKPRSEKRVADQLNRLDIHAYVPVQTQVRQWSDRRKKVEMVLFNRYVFVHLPDRRRNEVFRIPNVFRYLTYGGIPSALRPHEIRLIRQLTGMEAPVRVVDDTLCSGEWIEIMEGPLMGYRGQIIEGCNRFRVRIQVESLLCSVEVDLERVEVKKLPVPPC